METIPIPGAEIYYDRNFHSPEEATTLFNALRVKCAWERRKSSFGHAVPRDEAYYGDPGTSYIYSRREYRPLGWIAGNCFPSRPEFKRPLPTLLMKKRKSAAVALLVSPVKPLEDFVRLT